MKLPFGIEINFNREEKGRKPRSRRVLGGLLPNWWYGRELGTDSDYHAQLGAYSNEWVYTAASRNAQTVASTPLRLYTINNSNNKKSRFPTKEVDRNTLSFILEYPSTKGVASIRDSGDIEELISHPILDLMREVNPFMNGFDLWEITQLHQELTGNAYWLIINNGLGVPAEIWIIPPDRIKVVPDKEKFISGYLYEYGTFKQIIPEQNIIHFKMSNPNNLYYGVSPVMSATMTYKISRMMNEYQIAVFENRGQLAGAFETDHPLEDDQFERLKSEIREAFIGHKNSGATPLFENGVHFERYGSTLDELSFKDGKVDIKETILNIYGQNLALYDKSSTRANADAAQVSYARQAIRPRLFRIEQKLNEKFVHRWDNNRKLFLAWDNPVPEDELQASKIRSEEIRTGQLTINEARKQKRRPPLSDKPAAPGDEVLFQVQYAPLSAIVAGQTLKPFANQPNPSIDNNQPNKSIEKLAEELAPIIIKKMNKENKQNKQKTRFIT